MYGSTGSGKLLAEKLELKPLYTHKDALSFIGIDATSADELSGKKYCQCSEHSFPHNGFLQ